MHHGAGRFCRIITGRYDAGSHHRRIVPAMLVSGQAQNCRNKGIGHGKRMVENANIVKQKCDRKCYMANKIFLPVWGEGICSRQDLKENHNLE